MSSSEEDIYWNKGRISNLGRDTPEKREYVQTAKSAKACAPSNGNAVELTITYPHTAGYLRMTGAKQEILLREIFRLTCAALPIMYHVETKCFMEYDLHGQKHLHGWLVIDPTYRHYPIGLLSDMAKAALSNYPKKYNKFSDACMHALFTNYRCPQIKLQYRYSDNEEDVKRFIEWKGYCQKLQ